MHIVQNPRFIAGDFLFSEKLNEHYRQKNPRCLAGTIVLEIESGALQRQCRYTLLQPVKAIKKRTCKQ